MSGMSGTRTPQVLVVAATARELAAPDGWRVLCCGVGPVEAAASTAAAIAAHRPDAVLHVGIAGARAGSGLVAPAIVLGEWSRYCDLQVPNELAPRVIAPSPLLLGAVRRALPSAPLCTIGTTARVGGALAAASDGSDPPEVEAMEGFAVLRAAQLAGVPALEIRAISNAIEERDRTRWHFVEAFRAITDVTPRLVMAVQESLR